MAVDAERSGIGPAGTVACGSPTPARCRKAAPEYPLLHEGTADVFEGVPGGVVARGDGALIPVVGNNGVLGGLMGQGKSNAARVIMLGCATGPAVRDRRVHVREQRRLRRLRAAAGASTARAWTTT